MISLFFAFFLSFAHATSDFNCKTEYAQPLNIPMVQTQGQEEFFFCFGYHHGKDRAWEMDYFRRVGQGRNAEVYGVSHLKSDLMMRLLDLPAQAEKLWKNFSKDQKKWLELYSQGVNKGFETGKLSREFSEKNYLPEPWIPQHTLLVLLLQSFDQTRKTFFRDYEEERLKHKWGKSAESLFDEDNLPWENTILKDGEYAKKEVLVKTTSFKAKPAKLWAEFPTVFGLESGSNNWAVSKDKSRTGKALFANDPHLDLKTPMFWYWISLSTPQAKVIGASVPGVPVIASGTNGKVAWGLTNSYLNSADALFVQGLTSDDVESVRPWVMVKFWFFKLPFFFKSFEKLKSGHRVLPLENSSNEKMVLRWTGFRLRPEDIYPMFNLFHVQDVDDMDKLTSKIDVPSWNFVFADTKGDIGYRLVGKTYRHEEKHPLGIPTVGAEELNRENFLEAAEKPHVLRPLRGYVYSANNRHWPSDSKFYGGRGYSYSYRGFRIDELLKEKAHDVQSFQNIQCDRQVVDARFFVAKMLKYLELPEFQNWSMLATDDSKALPLFRRLMDLMKQNWEVNEYALFRLLDNLTPKQQEDLKSFHAQALEEVSGRTWGEIHRVKFSHMSKNQGWIFSPDLAGVGDTHSVDPGTSNWNPDQKIYEQFSGASMRFIVEMDKEPKIWLSLPGLNRDYQRQPSFSPWEEWKNCQYQVIKF